jgi:hypothetical protein
VCAPGVIDGSRALHANPDAVDALEQETSATGVRTPSM